MRNDGPFDERDERRIRTELFERIAHELRGPIGVTMGALDELERDVREGRDLARIESLLAMARRGARKALRTADRLSRAAQLGGGSVVIERVPTDLGELARRACEDASAIDARPNVHLEAEVPVEPCLVDLDAGWVLAALTELVAHSLRAARRSVRVSVARTATDTTFSVEDDRAGDHASFLPPPPSGDWRPRDAGLHVSIVHDVARLHAWEVAVERIRGESDDAHVGVAIRLIAPVLRG